MALAIRRHGYWLEPTPITIQKLPHADDDIPPLPPLPEARMTHVATPSPPRIPWVFLGSAFVLTVIMMLVLSHGLR
jgi:hypothetical protein